MAKKISVKYRSLERPYDETVMEDLKENLSMSYTERYEAMLKLNEFTLQVLRAQGIKPFDEKSKYPRKTQVIRLPESVSAR